MKTIFLSRRVLLLILALGLVCVVVFAACQVVSASSPKAEHTIVIDAGHGGVDGGAEGASGVSESYLNLQFAKTLQSICEACNFSVVMTRSDMNGLYSTFASNKKRSEMEKRKSIIASSGAEMVVSIHMNSFSSPEPRGAQVYHSATGKALADCVQTSLHEQIEFAKATAKVGDYYILNCTTIPSILVECGFLSNAEEEVLLQDEAYMQKFCNALFCGIVEYLSV